jgi:alpha-tubulin suppressor-like RCC1 family protein
MKAKFELGAAICFLVSGCLAAGEPSPAARRYPADLAAAGVRAAGAAPASAAVQPDEQIAEVAAGWSHVCVRWSDGAIGCWGSSGQGEIDHPLEPGYRAIAAGRNTSCALDAAGMPVCWGALDGAPERAFARLAVAEETACGLTATGEVQCWNAAGDAVQPPGAGRYRQIVGGWRFHCGLRRDGEVDCWGADYATVGTPPPPGPFVSISAGHEHVCAIQGTGRLVCWGQEDEGQMPPQGLTVDEVAAGERLTCVLRAGAVRCFGHGFGAGHGGPEGVFRQISASTDFACGVRDDGAAYCWDADSLLRLPPFLP